MSRSSKVLWKEGLFLQPHHFQQADRHFDRQLTASRQLYSAYPWGFARVSYKTEEGSIIVSEGEGFFPDGTYFHFPTHCPPPPSVVVPDSGANLKLWLTLPDTAEEGQNFGMPNEHGTRFIKKEVQLTDTTRALGTEQQIEVAVPRLELVIAEEKPNGFQCLEVAQIMEIRDGNAEFDKTAPPIGMTLDAHDLYQSYLNNVKNRLEDRLKVVARHASEQGAGLQNKDYLLLMVLNRTLPILRHLSGMKRVHPERLYETLYSLAGELTTFEDQERFAIELPPYQHEAPRETFQPMVNAIRRMLSRDLARAIRLPLKQNRNRYRADVADTSLFDTAGFYMDVSAAIPLTDIQGLFPQFCKVAPLSQIKEVVNSNLAGLQVTHVPNPPPAIRQLRDHVYFRVEKTKPLWDQFSVDPTLCMQIAGDWPSLEIVLYAIAEDG